jgi:hypothetical protein
MLYDIGQRIVFGVIFITEAYSLYGAGPPR